MQTIDINLQLSAVQLTVDNIKQVEQWSNGSIKGTALPIYNRCVDVMTPTGEQRAEMGDYIVQAAGGGAIGCWTAGEFDRLAAGAQIAQGREVSDPYAHILIAIAAGKQIQQFNQTLRQFDDIDRCSALQVIADDRCGANVDRFRVAPPTIHVGNMDVPTPFTGTMIFGQVYWVPSPTSMDLVMTHIWSGSCDNLAHHQRGFIHLVEANARQHARAINVLLGTQ